MEEEMSKIHNFTIIVSGIDVEESNFADRFFEARCDDATISIQKGLIVLEFDREARSFSSALLSALVAVEATGAKIERIEPDYLVNASDIANRSNLGRAAISNYAHGLRGKGFPHPVARVTTDSPLWDWVQVSKWMYNHHKISRSAVVEATVVREINRIVAEDRPASSNIGRHLQTRRYDRDRRIVA
jgi:hypothetical protein